MTDSRTVAIEALVEGLAAIEHEQWMAWASTIAMNEAISPERLARWGKSMVPYADLPDDVKEQDREWVRKTLATPPVAALLARAALADVLAEALRTWHIHSPSGEGCVEGCPARAALAAHDEAQP